ncbi:MAG: hypothetical protein EZS28_016530, partial [Streblomastix strix]
MEETDFKKIALRWVPYTLTKEQKNRRVIAAREMLSQLIQMRRNNFVHAITGDETWIYYKNPPNSAWIRRGEEAPKRVAKGTASPEVLVT